MCTSNYCELRFYCVSVVIATRLIVYSLYSQRWIALNMMINIVCIRIFPTCCLTNCDWSGIAIVPPPCVSLMEAINKGGRVLVHCREGVSRPQQHRWLELSFWFVLNLLHGTSTVYQNALYKGNVMFCQQTGLISTN